MGGPEISKQFVPLTCHGHSRPVTHLSFSGFVDGEEDYYLISACKDNNPMLRDGVTGDWIGTFFGHKGAVYQARLSPDASTAATASADFTVMVWDTHSGEVIGTLQHNHIVRAIAFPPEQGHLLATGGMEMKLRIFDLSKVSPISPPAATPTQKKMVINVDGKANGATDRTVIPAEEGFEVGPGVHKGTIKAIVWTKDPNILITAADDKMIRWWDLRTRTVVQEVQVQGEIGSCEFTNVAPQIDDIGAGFPVLVIAAGKTVYFYGGHDSSTLIKSVEMPYNVASAALHPSQGKFVTGSFPPDTWAKVYDYDTEQELDVHKGHHGPIWSISFSPDGKLYATGSEDGTIKMWKNCKGPFGLWKADRE
ncbi:WD40-repeat-containing domain protein [Amylocarpus encephaloides]|uniref:Serine-threonine kinase receptor-associated protein n=1 Tax=Amylocarpus encephaloides TaxID=45428 RepID=A0A9P7YFE7_9HELO|nr:WD40-repeat-containing domain protein [Amylocarpus encephaloides]